MKLYSKNQVILCTVAGAILAVILTSAAFRLFSRTKNNSADASEISAASKEPSAEAEIAAVRKGIDSAQQSAADIADSNGGGTAVADQIADSQQSAQTGITDAEESVERIADQSDRIAEASQRAKNNIESAEAANQSAAGALERALQLCRECRELNTGSESIITTGQTENAGGSKGARKN